MAFHTTIREGDELWIGLERLTVDYIGSHCVEFGGQPKLYISNVIRVGEAMITLSTARAGIRAEVGITAPRAVAIKVKREAA